MSMPMLRPLAVTLLALFLAADAGAARAAGTADGGPPAGRAPLLAQAESDAVRPWLGVGLTGGPDAANTGVPIRAVAEGSPAAAAGIAAGDTLLAIDGETVTSATEAAERIGAMAPGTVVKLRILHAGEPTDIEVTLGTRPAQD